MRFQTHGCEVTCGGCLSGLWPADPSACLGQTSWLGKVSALQSDFQQMMEVDSTCLQDTLGSWGPQEASQCPASPRAHGPLLQPEGRVELRDQDRETPLSQLGTEPGSWRGPHRAGPPLPKAVRHSQGSA